jgi:MFS family permease
MPRLRVGLDEFLRAFLREWRFIFATASASGVGYLGTVAAPVIVQALIESGLNHQQAGNLGTIELMMLALSSTLITPYVPIVSHRKLAIGGALVAAVGLVFSVLSTSLPEMVIGRIITGLGSGLAIAGANAAVAARADAERIFAIIWTMGGAVTASIARYMPDHVKGGNYPVGFSILLLICLVGIPFMAWVPPRSAPLGFEPIVRAAAAREPEGEPAGLRTVFGPMALMALLGMLIYSAAEQGLWQFAYNIPLESGIPKAVASKVLAFTTLMGLAGGVAAAVLGTRLGRIAPLIIGSLLSAIGRWVYIATTGSEWLLVGGLMWGLGFYFVTPYQIGLVAALDRHGRVAVAAGAATNLGYAIGPTVAGRILQHLDSSALIIAVCGASVMSMLLMLPLAIRVERVAAGDSAAHGRSAPR